jgi:hypothetical protein
MRRLGPWVVTLAISSVASAAVPVYTQPPNGGSGSVMLSSGNGNDYDRFVFDNFTLASAADIGRITWRGAYLYGTGYPSAPVLDFDVSFYPSLNYAPPYDQPAIGTGAVWHVETTGGSASETPAGVVAGTQMYDYTFTLPTKFHAAANTQYWLRIGAFQAGICGWGFSSATGGDNRYFGSFINYAGGTSYAWWTGDAAFTLWTTPPAGTWNRTGGGNWGSSINWSGEIPNTIDAAATFGAMIDANATITVNVPVTVGTLAFDNVTSCYTLAGANAITLDVSTGAAAVQNLSGRHVIAAPLVLNDDVTIEVASATDALVVTGPMTAGGRNLTKTGAGAARFEDVRARSLTVDAGAVQISGKAANNSAAGCSVLAALTVAPGAQLDLTNNSAVIDYDARSPLTSTLALLQTGYAAGAWTGDGIVSSAAAVPAPSGRGITGVGYAESADILGAAGGVFAGQSVDSTAVLLRYTYCGDANLDGKVDLTDFTFLAANFNATGDGTWARGDFNYDGNVDLTDFTFLAANFNLTLAGPSAAVTVVPEPLRASFAFAGGAALLRRRRGPAQQN